MKVKGFFFICFVANLLLILIYVALIFAVVIRSKELIDYIFYDSGFAIMRMIIAYPTIILWVYTLKIWSKYDKHVGRFMLLFFFIGLYSPFYYLKARKAKWID